jgi:hypothetical protein
LYAIRSQPSGVSDERVVTIFCCGTAFHSEIQGEVLADTYRKVVGRKWINQGPGNFVRPIVKARAVMEERSYDPESHYSAWKLPVLMRG